MLPILLHLLLVIQFTPSNIVSFDPLLSLAAPSFGRLDAFNRRVTFETSQLLPTSLTSTIDPNDPCFSDEWLPITLPNGPSPSAIAAGSIWSLPLLARGESIDGLPYYDFTTSKRIPLLAVATGKILRLYSPIARSNSNLPTSREFGLQPIITSSTMSSELKLSRCACGLVLKSPPAPTNEVGASLASQLYVWDSFGGLSSMNVSQGRLSTSNNLLKSWQLGSEREEIRSTGRNTVTDDNCPPCYGDGLIANATASQQGGIFYSPRTSVVRSAMVDANSDGELDFVTVRSNLTMNMMTFTSTNDRSDRSMGLEVSTYLFKNSSITLGPSRFDMVVNSVTANGISTDLLSSHQFIQTASHHPSNLFESIDHISNGDILSHDELGTSMVPLGGRLRALAMDIDRNWPSHRANYFATTIAPVTASITSSPSNTIQIVRQPDDIVFGYFDGDNNLDVAISVSDYCNSSQALVSRRSGPPQLQSGVTIKRRLITLFGTSQPLEFRFDSSKSVSQSIDSATTFLPGTTIVRPTIAVSSFKPLLSMAIALDHDSSGLIYTAPNVSTVVFDDMLRSVSAFNLTNLIDLGLQPFPFRLISTPSPLFESAASYLKSFQLDKLTMVRHDIGKSMGEVKKISNDGKGSWLLNDDAPLQVVIEDDPLQEPDLPAIDWSTTTAGAIDLLALASTVESFGELLPSITVGPHPNFALALVPSETIFGGAQYQAGISTTYFDTYFIGNMIQLTYDEAIHILYSTHPPSLLTLIDVGPSLSVSDDTLQHNRLTEFHVQLLESYRVGWSEGLRENIRAIALEEQPNRTSDWRRIIGQRAPT